MIISNSQKYVFIHLNKTAGTSVTRALADQLAWNDLAIGVPPMNGKFVNEYRKKFGLHKHCTARAARDILGQSLWNDFFTFGFVRNPYARAVSDYTYIKRLVDKRGWRRHIKFARNPNEGLWDWPGTKAYLETKDFSSFLRHPEAVKSSGLVAQSLWLCDEEGKVIVDFVGKLETLASDMEQISTQLGLEGIQIGHHNKSSSEKWLTHYKSVEDLQIVTECFGNDFEIFGYERIDAI